MRRIDSTLSQIASRNGQPSTMPAFSKALKTTHDHTTNALLPIILPFGAGVVGFVATGLMAFAWGWPFRVPLTATGILMLIFLFGTTAWVIAGRLIEGKEEIWGPTIQAAAASPPINTHFDMSGVDGRYGLRGQYPINPELLIEWCIAAVNQQSLSHAAWDAKFATPGTGDGRAEYEKFRSWLVSRGWAKEVGGNVGLRILWRNPQALSFVSGFAGVNPEDGTPLLDSYTEGAKNTGSHRLTHTRTQTEVLEEGDDMQEGEPDEG